MQAIQAVPSPRWFPMFTVYFLTGLRLPDAFEFQAGPNALVRRVFRRPGPGRTKLQRLGDQFVSVLVLLVETAAWYRATPDADEQIERAVRAAAERGLDEQPETVPVIDFRWGQVAHTALEVMKRRGNGSVMQVFGSFALFDLAVGRDYAGPGVWLDVRRFHPAGIIVKVDGEVVTDPDRIRSLVDGLLASRGWARPAMRLGRTG